MDASSFLLTLTCAFVGALFGYNIGWLRGYDERTARDDDDDSVELTAT